MLIGQCDGIEIHLKEEIIYMNFLVLRRAISNCSANGRLCDNLEGIVNHQSCEPSGHDRKVLKSIVKTLFDYLKLVCEKYGLSPEKKHLFTL